MMRLGDNESIVSSGLLVGLQMIAGVRQHFRSQKFADASEEFAGELQCVIGQDLQWYPTKNYSMIQENERNVRGGRVVFFKRTAFVSFENRFVITRMKRFWFSNLGRRRDMSIAMNSSGFDGKSRFISRWCLKNRWFITTFTASFHQDIDVCRWARAVPPSLQSVIHFLSRWVSRCSEIMRNLQKGWLQTLIHYQFQCSVRWNLSAQYYVTVSFHLRPGSRDLLGHATEKCSFLMLSRQLFGGPDIEDFVDVFLKFQ